MWNAVDIENDAASGRVRARRRSSAVRAVTRTEELRLQIADEITSGRLAPGTALEEVEIAKRYGVSRTPVREAIRDLAASGLVEARPHRSALVARPSMERLRGMFEVMAELECMCAVQAAVHMTAAERAGLERLHAELAIAIHAGEETQCGLLDERFHAAVNAGCHNDYLAELAVGTRIKLRPFLKDKYRGLERLAQSYAEHDRVLTAIQRGDRAEAGEAMRAHVFTTPVLDGAAVAPAASEPFPVSLATA
ncbi:GntR family transcriptional regulator [Xanthobacter agilis]|uniref:GntR family transcriptional regulator n=1 Tax=Xanthobacter agilis TaxID=47492 RepID=UPI00235159D0|nr:GntR family transcriptional regulator [Xanthobacter agilis]